ncbi:MAG: hypothetical protein Q8R50_04495, partial [Sediminibacterium sp.]|nr:hypothetical protein [Sediminibacterium sp.]
IIKPSCILVFFNRPSPILLTTTPPAIWLAAAVLLSTAANSAPNFSRIPVVFTIPVVIKGSPDLTLR